MGDYTFQVNPLDGQVTGDGVDRFRILIWNKTTGLYVYDNEIGSPPYDPPVTRLRSGGLFIRK